MIVAKLFSERGQSTSTWVGLLALLEEYGVVVIHPQAAEALRKAGALAGAGADRLRLPRGLGEEALRETPKQARLCGKRFVGVSCMQVGGKHDGTFDSIVCDNTDEHQLVVGFGKRHLEVTCWIPSQA